MAGFGEDGFNGDGGTAISAKLSSPRGLGVDRAGNLYISDFFNHRVRRVDGVTGVITTVAGTGEDGFHGDGGPATNGQLRFPQGVAVDKAGNLFVSDWGNNRIRRVSAANRTISTVAGTGDQGFRGDGGPATNARVRFPQAVAVDEAGNLYFADTGNITVRLAEDVTGVIDTVAGTGEEGFEGDEEPASLAMFKRPAAVAVDPSGNLFIGDPVDDQVRAVSAPFSDNGDGP